MIVDSSSLEISFSLNKKCNLKINLSKDQNEKVYFILLD
jgi:hypothetical protein